MQTKKEKSAATERTAPTGSDGPTSKALRLLDETFEEWRYEPSARPSAYFGALLLSFGGLLLGGGTFALSRISEGAWHENAWLMLTAGLVLEVAFLILGGKPEAAVHVGQLGVAHEADGKLERLAWCDITRVSIVADGLKLETDGKPVLIGFEHHTQAAARVAAEAKKRIPKRVMCDEDELAGLGESRGGEKVTAEAAQVGKSLCRATGEALTFEKDVRMCGNCGALYHRNGVPRRCTECSRKLKAA